MTNKEAAIWLLNLSADIGQAEHQSLWHYEQALTEIREMLEQDVPDTNIGKWISVSERLPEPNALDGNVVKYYLVQNEYGDMMVASLQQSPDGTVTWWEQMYHFGVGFTDVVAWMPLPEPWKGESDVGNQK